MSTSPTVAVLGVGGIGTPIARLWQSAGHPLVLGSRTPDRLRDRLRAFDLDAEVTSPRDAARKADIALLAVPYPALAEFIDSVGDLLADKVVIDATNPMGVGDDGAIVSTLGPAIASGEHTARLLPRSHVVRAFSHVMEELLWPRGTGQRGFWGMAVAGDEPGPKGIVSSLVADAGFVPVDIGSLRDSAVLDPGGVLFPHMFTPADLARAARTPVAARG